MNTPRDATECGPIVDPKVRLEELIDRAAGLVDPFEADARVWCVTDPEQVMFLLARGHKPAEVIPSNPGLTKEVWFFWPLAQAELPN
jgi:hypothetical protein